MAKKDEMWISCCGCGLSINVPKTTKLIYASNTEIIWKSTCPNCGFEHKVRLTRW